MFNDKVKLRCAILTTSAMLQKGNTVREGDICTLNAPVQTTLITTPPFVWSVPQISVLVRSGPLRSVPCFSIAPCNVSQQSAVRMRFWGGTGLHS